MQFIAALVIFAGILTAAAYVPTDSHWHLALLIAGTPPFLIICKTSLQAICRGIERMIPEGRIKRALTKPRAVDQVVYEGWPLPIPRVKPHWLKATLGLIILAAAVVLVIADAIHH